MNKNESLILLVVVCIIATCGLIYELIAGTVASYLMGDSVTQFSLVIGTYLFAMGVGAWASKYFPEDSLLEKFVLIEYMVGIIGGVSATVLLTIFQLAIGFQMILFAFVLITGILVGLEIPLLMRILKNSISFDTLVSRVFSYDYLGALFASIIFPLLFLPKLGLSKTAIFFGVINIVAGIATTSVFKEKLKRSKPLLAIGFFSLICLLLLFVYSNKIMNFQDELQYPGKVIYSKQSQYQRIVIARQNKSVQLYLNGNLQFNSADEHRYHEALVHPAAMASASLKNVLVLGGGDGMAIRELLKYPSIEKIQLVDLDAEMTKLFTTHPKFSELNQKSLSNKKVTVTNTDAFLWLKKNTERFDLVIVDFPDPSNFAIGKLYSNLFYAELKNHLSKNAWAVVQCTSPFAAKNSYWSIDKTIRSVGFNTIPYYNDVPSFGMWGYILASADSVYEPKRECPADNKFFTHSMFALMRSFPKDMLPTKPLEVNQLNTQSLVTLFEEEWNKYLQ
jgi:spermidine synthase